MRGLFTIAAVAALAGSANAGTVTATYAGLGQNSGTYRVRLLSNVVDVTVNAGALKHNVAGSSQMFAGEQLRTFCVDLAQTVSGTQRVYTISSVADAPDPDAPTGNIGEVRAARLESLYANAIQAGLLDSRGSATNAMGNNEAAAFQLVVWELAFENPVTVDIGALSFSDGDLQITSSKFAETGFTDLVADYFAWAMAGDSLKGLRAMVSNDAQDQLIVIPAPVAGMAGMFGLLGVAGIRRRAL